MVCRPALDYVSNCVSRNQMSMKINKFYIAEINHARRMAGSLFKNPSQEQPECLILFDLNCHLLYDLLFLARGEVHQPIGNEEKRYSYLTFLNSILVEKMS